MPRLVVNTMKLSFQEGMDGHDQKLRDPVISYAQEEQ